ncbi:hypothetical protein ACVXHA_11095 [Escherichia coli]
MVEYEGRQPHDGDCAGAKVITFFLTFGSLLGMCSLRHCSTLQKAMHLMRRIC